MQLLMLPAAAFSTLAPAFLALRSCHRSLPKLLLRCREWPDSGGSAAAACHWVWYTHAVAASSACCSAAAFAAADAPAAEARAAIAALPIGLACQPHSTAAASADAASAGSVLWLERSRLKLPRRVPSAATRAALLEAYSSPACSSRRLDDSIARQGCCRALAHAISHCKLPRQCAPTLHVRHSVKGDDMLNSGGTPGLGRARSMRRGRRVLGPRCRRRCRTKRPGVWRRRPLRGGH